MKYVAAVDVGGTSIKAALVSQDLEVVTTSSRPTPQSDISGVETAKTIAAIVTELSKVHPVSAVGFAVPGALSESEGISRWTGNLGWKDLPIREIVAREVQLPVAFGHDVRVGALAELRSGAAREFQQSIFIPIGTGIAAALVIDGKIRTSDGYAGEIGHLNVGHDLPCVCGLSGCLETISSASAISREYQRRTGFSISVNTVSNANGTSWLGDNFDPVLLYGSMREAMIFMKGEQDMVSYYEDKYKEALQLAIRLGNGMERGDAYRDGQTKLNTNLRGNVIT